jgi:hypothetical protein
VETIVSIDTLPDETSEVLEKNHANLAAQNSVIPVPCVDGFLGLSSLSFTLSRPQPPSIYHLSSFFLKAYIL